MHLADVDLRLGKLLRRGGAKVRERLLHVLLAVHEPVAPDDAQPVVRLLLPVVRPALEPHLREHRVLLHALAPQVHPPEVPRRERGVPGLRGGLALGGAVGLPGVRGVARPDLLGDAEEVVAGAVEVPRDGGRAVAARGDSAGRAVDAALVVDLAETVREVDLSTIGVELSRVRADTRHHIYGGDLRGSIP